MDPTGEEDPLSGETWRASEKGASCSGKECGLSVVPVGMGLKARGLKERGNMCQPHWEGAQESPLHRSGYAYFHDVNVAMLTCEGKERFAVCSRRVSYSWDNAEIRCTHATVKS